MFSLGYPAVNELRMVPVADAIGCGQYLSLIPNILFSLEQVEELSGNWVISSLISQFFTCHLKADVCSFPSGNILLIITR